ncbi:hypothetical protein TRFO_27682 [Tritrichomonas foetus]|uniref:Uncharacterized protein n=1 Tax=Tritrichomonas foetus TaxID=1144522 RepID=A0A1J4K5D8_9EUKA|nr:hypothetical protein TRFO_27682 [Tritrichomonas foetus]|eukprot:OHT04685.1 hypothetical protein TRFO_27682 [Tritrichomonas foetus]
MGKSPYVIQRKIVQQNSESDVLDWRINNYQQQATSLLKDVLIKKHLYIQRLFYTEMYLANRVKCPLEHSAFVSNGEEVYSNFASIILPDDFSKGPMKAFLNTLLDSLESFLPAFYKLNPSKLPRGSFATDPSNILLRCVFPSLFAYCWAEEPAVSYAQNLVTWFGEIYRENPKFITNFDKHWMFQAIRGFFTSLDVSLFIRTAIRPFFFEFSQLESKDIQKTPEILLKFAIEILNSIHENFSKLPSVINLLFSEIFKIIQNEDEKRLMMRYIFFDLFISPFFANPILSDVSDVQLPFEDYEVFSDIYLVFKVKLGTVSEKERELTREIQALPDFENKFNIDLIFNDIQDCKASLKLPLLREFCDFVQCAHQPLLMTTHSLSLLFRFVASLQHTALLPRSIDRSISNVFQYALADKLEILQDYYFWFPCFSLTYLKIPEISFVEQMKPSSLYRLFSSDKLKLSPVDSDFRTALVSAMSVTNILTNPDLRTDIQWLLINYDDSQILMSEILTEIERKQQNNKHKKKRANDLIKFSKILKHKLSSISSGPLRAIVHKLIDDFKASLNDISIRSNHFLDRAHIKIEEFCGKSYPIIGSYLATMVVVDVTPCLKYQKDPTKTTSSDEELYLRKMISKPLLVSSLYSTASKLIPNLIILEEYAKLENIADPLLKAYSEPYVVEPEMLAANIDNLLLTLPNALLKLVFTETELIVLQNYTKTFKLPDPIPI